VAASSPAARKDRATGVNGARNTPKYGAKLPVCRMAISRLRDRRLHFFGGRPRHSRVAATGLAVAVDLRRRASERLTPAELRSPCSVKGRALGA
jgi:hypothetical protein